MRALRAPARLLTHLRWDRRCATRAFAPAVRDAGLRAFGLAPIRPLQSTSNAMARANATHMRTGKFLAEDLEVERSMLGRTAGLMFRRRLAPGAGMWIVPCNGIHMMFMNFAIDAVFLDRQ